MHSLIVTGLHVIEINVKTGYDSPIRTLRSDNGDGDENHLISSPLFVSVMRRSTLRNER